MVSTASGRAHAHAHAHAIYYGLVLGVVLLALLFRLHGHRWDDGWYMHPDERHVVMVMTERLHRPALDDLGALLDPARSPLNTRSVDEEGRPRSFAYGSLPLFVTDLVAGAGSALTGKPLNDYGHVGLLGRYLTALLDVGTILLAMAFARRAFGRLAAIMTGFLLATTVLMIQLAHFFTVDAWVTFFSTAVLYAALRATESASRRWMVAAGIFLGCALATKVSVVSLGAPILAAAVLSHRRLPPVEAASRALRDLLLVAATCVVTFALWEPYALWAPSPFINDALTQWRIVTGRFDVPFTRQFVGLIPVRYELGNLVHWGLGVTFGLIALAAVAIAVTRLRHERGPRLIVLSWIVPYFIVIASAEAKFLRYSAPLVPALAILSAALLAPGLRRIGRLERGPLLATGAAIALLVGNLAWAVAFDAIYRQPHSRIAASEWIYRNIPPGSTITSEYWDDPLPLPLMGQAAPGARYRQLSLDLYADRANQEALDYIVRFLGEADYIMLSSDRLARSIPRLPWRYPVVAEYYRLLESGQLGFRLIYESDVTPRLGSWRFDDRGADESFTVYDHPRVRIFEKVTPLSRDDLERRFAWGLSQPYEPARYPSSPSLLLGQRVSDMPAADDLGWSANWTSHGVLASVLWLLLVGAVGLATLPLTLSVFHRFADVGWGFARALGLLVVGYGVWISVHLQLIEFRLPEMLLPAALVAGACWLSLGGRAWKVLTTEESRRKTIVASEIAFVAGFLFFLWLRALNPDLWQTYWGGEKPMEMSFIQGVARSATFPPFDPWFAHGVMNYYYYGFYLMALLWKLSGVPPEIAFQLGIATVGALLVSVTFSLAGTLGSDLLRTRRVAWFVGAGAIGVLLHTFVGNLDAARQVLTGRGAAFDFWQSSRVVDYTITEFPYFTMIWADLHPHAINLPFVMLLLACSYAILRDPSSDRWPSALLLALTALVVGSIAVVNSWDMPLALVLPAAALTTVAIRSPGRRLVLLFRAVIISGAIAGGMLALFWPFFSRFVALVGGIDRTARGTSLSQYLVHFGLFLGLLASVAFVVLLRDVRWDRAERKLVVVVGLLSVAVFLVAGIVSKRLDSSELIAGSIIALLLGGAAISVADCLAGQAATSRLWRVGAVGLLALSLAIAPVAPTRALLVLTFGLGVALWQRFAANPPIAFASLAFTGATAITLLADLVYVVDDLSGSPWERMNSVFKFYLEAWTLFALAASVAMVWLLSALVRTATASPLGIVAGQRPHVDDAVRLPLREQQSPLPAVGVASGLAVLLILTGLLYPLVGTPARLAQAMPGSPDRLTLDGLAWMSGSWIQSNGSEHIDFGGDRAAIDWLRAESTANDVIIEGSIGPYRGNGARIAAGTGLPSVLGWDRHERQQRYWPGIDRRLADVRLFYTSVDLELKRRILDQYGVRYVIVGDVERFWRVERGFAGTSQADELYSTSEGIAAIEQMVGTDLRVAYSSGDTTVYEVTPFSRLRPTSSRADN